jgi:SAM-dependent methyltransferase
MKKKCPVCQTAKHLITKYRYREGVVSVCKRCDLAIFLGPMPKSAGADIAEEGVVFQYLKRLVLRYEFNHLKKYQKLRLLEIGSGSGELAKMLSRQGHRVECNDVDLASLKRISRKFKLKTLYGPIDTLKIKDKTYDGVVFRHVFEHIDNPEVLVATIHRILKNNGKLFITQPNYNSLCRRIIGKNWTGFSVPNHRYSWSLSNFKLFLEVNGFKVIKTRTFFSHFGLPLNLSQFVKNKYLNTALNPLFLVVGSVFELFFVLVGRGQNLFIEAEKYE